jgi:hypothetical protein
MEERQIETAARRSIQVFVSVRVSHTSIVDVYTRALFGFRADVSMANEGTKRGLQKPLFHFFLADNAVASPWHCFETLLLKFLMAGDAFPKAIVLVDPSQGVIH